MSENNVLAVQTINLTRKYGEFIAVDNLNFKISKGEIFGLLGPNGSGKTTIILMLLGLTEPTSGKVKVMGHDPIREPFKVKRMVGYLPERLGFYENITALQNLRYFARLNQMDETNVNVKIKESLIKVGLGDSGESKVKTFSRGMKQRMGIANVLLKDPELIILDEPTQGIDPKGIQEILDLFITLNKENQTTIMLSSHLIHHVQQVCDNIGIMSQGKMRVRAKLDLSELSTDQDWITEFEMSTIPYGIEKKLEAIPQISALEKNGRKFIAHARKDVRPEIAKTVIENGGALLSLNLLERSLINIYKKYSEEN